MTDPIYWIIGGICCVAGLSDLYQGNSLIGFEKLGFGLVLIAVGDEELRRNLTNLFWSRFRSQNDDKD